MEKEEELSLISNQLLLNGTLTKCPSLLHGKMGISIFFPLCPICTRRFVFGIRHGSDQGIVGTATCQLSGGLRERDSRHRGWIFLPARKKVPGFGRGRRSMILTNRCTEPYGMILVPNFSRYEGMCGYRGILAR